MGAGPTTTQTGTQSGKSSTTGQSSTELTGSTQQTGATTGQSSGATTGATSGATSSAAWAPSQPLLEGQLGYIGALQGSGAPNTAESAGLGGITDTAAQNAGLNNKIVSDAGNMLAGGGFGAGDADVQSAYKTAAGALTPMLGSDFLDFSKNPEIQQLENTITDTAKNAVGGAFSAAGRGGPNVAQYGAPNGQYAGTLAKNITQQLAAPLLNEYNTLLGTQLSAAGDLTGAANAKSGALNSSASGALGAETAAPGFLASDLDPYKATFAAGQEQQLLPVQYQEAINQALIPIAQTGSTGQSSGTSSGTSTGTTSGTSTSDQTQRLLQDATSSSRTRSSGTSGSTSTTQTPIGSQIGSDAVSLLGAWLGSDPRMKKDAAPVGMLFDGTPVHKFKYKGSNTTRIGLMSPQVQQRNPAAVKTGNDGLQRVNYELATRQAQRIGQPLLGGGY